MSLALVKPGWQPTSAENAPVSTPVWGLQELSGRLVEVSGGETPAPLTAAFGLVVEAQLAGDTAAWITLESSSFFPPDADESGVDLAALPIVRVPDARSASRAADYLVRSGGFGLVVIDLAAESGTQLALPVPVLTRLLGLARAHDVAVIVLTKKSRDAASLNSLISLRAEAQATRTGDDRFEVAVDILKDKRGGPGWRHVEVCHGSVGLR